jgi:sulfide:quinone oxidoreductase
MVRAIEPATRRVETDAGSFDADVMVVALGADLDPMATPGLVEVGHEFYTVAGAFALRDVLAKFGGGRVIVGVTSAPFKCPPAPSETALLVHDYLVERGLRADAEVSLVMPFGAPIPPSPAASRALLEAFAARGITWHPTSRRTVVLADGGELPFDLFLGVPVHRVPEVVQNSGLCADGWIPVNPLTLETGYPGVYAVGDVTSVGTPKAGVFAEGQAAVVANEIIAHHRGGPHRSRMVDVASATWSSVTIRSAASMLPFAVGSAPPGSSRGHRLTTRPTSPSSARAASGGGLAERGPIMDDRRCERHDCSTCGSKRHGMPQRKLVCNRAGH